MNLKLLEGITGWEGKMNLNSHLWDYEPETEGGALHPCGVPRISIPIYGIMNLKLLNQFDVIVSVAKSQFPFMGL